jgi:hypothetical protein
MLKNHENLFNLMEKEISDLERLASKFGKNSGIIDIQGDFVYGYINNKREYLGSLAEYSRYKKLKSKYKHHAAKSDSQRCEEEAYKSFLETSRSNKSHNP